MIVVDTSALVTFLLGEPEVQRCQRVLQAEDRILISAGTLAEALIVAGWRGFSDKMRALIERLNCEILPVTADVARRAADAYGRWGKGNHPARLNLGDCFAYAAASEHGCPLLYVGDDFARTDLGAALP